jgi:hypothetical protein
MPKLSAYHVIKGMGKSDFYIVVVSKGKKIANASLN